MLYPKPLKQGDLIALINLSSAVPAERLELSIEAVKARGFQVRVYDSCKQKYYNFSGSDAQRAKDFEDAFCNDEVDGIFCIRGGYGAARALELVNWDRVKMAVCRNPKYFSGYSDVTAAHVALNEICKLVTWHTPMPSTEYYKPLDDYTETYLSASMGEQPIRNIINPNGVSIDVLVSGKAVGRLIGGNLSLVSAAIGTDFDMDTKGKIIFLEDIEEPSYRIDQMLVQMKQSGKFDDCTGVILGAWTDCQPNEGDMPLDVIFEDIFKNLGKPVLRNLRCGHCLPTASLPLGAMVEIDNGTIMILEE